MTDARRTALRRAGLLLALIVLLDLVIRTADPDYAVLGVLDEPAHLATGALLALAVSTRTGPWSRSAWLTVLAAACLIDADHVPAALGSNVLTHGTPRPYTHSLTTVAVLLLLALAARALRRRHVSALLAVAALGVGGHLLRDLGTAPVALFWPVSDAGVTLPYAGYLAVLVAAALAAVAGARRPQPAQPVHEPVRTGGPQ
ncbi:hypothetical protein GCM10025868_20070 [Angustibacter aerolatus]|uniref:Metal-dependent hydrolase n=1 Tax=Angustibacter aerolatus TaxID=1162965 RepID=A0ABQ6JEX4_9ACTN|nr:metal-dependent hydrolase [Angustibacter aerolatus]GMA86757.1 hypothetical protein GCM10025868_20070 [Angustibacter aerolatus]